MFQSCHRPYAYLMLTISTIVILLPSLYIFLNPRKLLHKCNFLKLRMMLLPHEITKIFHQSFKNGTQEGTLDCRWFAGIHLVIRLIVATSVTFKSSIFQGTQILVSITGLLLIVIFRPHTNTIFNCTDSVLFGGLAILSIPWSARQSQHIAKVLIFFVPLLILLIFVNWKLFQKLAIGGKLKICYYCCYRCFRGMGFRELQLCAGNHHTSAREWRPFLDKENLPGVPCTVVAITNY